MTTYKYVAILRVCFMGETHLLHSFHETREDAEKKIGKHHCFVAGIRHALETCFKEEKAVGHGSYVIPWRNAKRWFETIRQKFGAKVADECYERLKAEHRDLERRAAEKGGVA